MPAELLLPLFAVVLALNALFVGLAIRSLWRGRDGESRTATWTSLPVREDVLARSIRERATGQTPRPVPAEDDGTTGDRDHDAEPAAADEPGPQADASAVAGPTSEAPMAPAPDPDPTSGGPVAPAPAPDPDPTGPTSRTSARTEARPSPQSRPALDPGGTATPSARPPRTPRRASASASASTPAPGSAPRPGSRRRFALPPLDEDHEKVRRSIETFLGGADASAPNAPPDPASILTVAVIGLAGPDGPLDPRHSRRPRETGAPEAAGPSELRAMLQRTVRSTARGSDVVSIDRHGRVRVILPGTGELAAHAYLRRIRAIVEPIAEAATPPTRVVVATATDLDGSVASARRRADRRFAAALEGRSGAAAGAAPPEPAEAPDETIVKPRAAGD